MSIFGRAFCGSRGRILVPLFISVVIGDAVVGPARGAEAEPLTSSRQVVSLDGRKFTLPAGFSIERVAGPPLVDRPIVADFDEQGNLYVADSSGSNESVEKQLEKRPHRIIKLQDTDGDGRFDRRTIFADRMMFPEGCLWRRGSLYVSAPPSIWKLTDADGDGVADRREEWLPAQTLTGCANDLHGPYLGRDGWIYWAKGAFARQSFDREGKPPFVTRAAHIFRARPDGSGRESVMAGGMDNPVDVVFTPQGERIFTCTFLQHPGGGKRDGLIHALYGGVYGKDHDVIHEHPWTGPALLPPMTHLGPAAPCGLALYESETFGPQYRDNLFAALFNLHKITRHGLRPAGATFQTQDEDFLTTDDIDFHPTDVLDDADGSLLVIDTGGWYKLCCPTSQLDKPDVLGAIYRIRRVDAPPVADPRGKKIDWRRIAPDQLAPLLADPRPAVVRRAAETLVDRGPAAHATFKKVVASAPSDRTRTNAVWVASQWADGSALVRSALTDNAPSVRQAAAHAAGLSRDAESRVPLSKLLDDPDLAVRRAAAEALGRLESPAAIPSLLQAVAASSDPALQHSLIYALIEIGDQKPLLEALESDNFAIRRAGLIALDQLGAGELQPEHATRELSSADAPLRDAAWWIVGRHPDWGNHVARILRAQIAAELPPPQRAALRDKLAQLASSPAIQTMLEEQLDDPQSSSSTLRLVLEGMSAARLKHAPDAWATALARRIEQAPADDLEPLLVAARNFRLEGPPAQALASRLEALAGDKSRPENIRLLAAAALPPSVKQPAAAWFDLALAALGEDRSAADRALACEALTRARLDTAELSRLGESLRHVGPIELDRLLPLFAASHDAELGRALLASLSASRVKSALRADVLQPALAQFGPEIRAAGDKLLASLNQDAAQQRQILESTLARLPSGDIRRGQLVFHSSKAACFSCHAIGYVGGNVGPDLTSIGKIRSDRDLLEAVLFPSASLVRSFESVRVLLESGRTHNGVVREETADEIRLATGPDQEVRIPRGEIESIDPSQVSVMPAGLDKQLTAQELADLLAFLKSRR